MKIFGIGLGKTGTTSLNRAMRILGYKAKQGVRDIKWISHYDFVNNGFVVGQWKFLDHIFPDSKFILTTRDIDSWLKSSMEKAKYSGAGNINRYFNRFAVFGTICRLNYETEEEIERKMRVAYYEHHAKVYRHFRDQPERLLTMNIINDKDGWEKLCSFLGKEIPQEQFPYKNRTNYKDQK